MIQSSQNCKVCSNGEKNNEFTAREMMFGTRDEFQYLECSKCGCLQLLEIPDALEKYYPSDYYSFQPKKKSLRNSIDLYIKKQIALHRLNKSVIGGWLLFLNKRYLKWLNTDCGLTFESKILDVGCGSGKLLKELSNIGFRNLTGIDPFIEKDLKFDSIQIFKKHINEIDGQFDFIMLHHSYEHMFNPAEIVLELKRILAPEGRILIRIPVADSYAWRTYGRDWVELDAPRHAFLHTQKSMEHLVKSAGLKIFKVLHDSSKYEIIGSEQHKLDIPSIEKVNLFTTRQLKVFEQKVDELNANGDAGRACFYISN